MRSPHPFQNVEDDDSEIAMWALSSEGLVRETGYWGIYGLFALAGEEFHYTLRRMMQTARGRLSLSVPLSARLFRHGAESS